MARSCCVDQKPQQMDVDRAALLCNFAELVVRELEAGWAARRQRLHSLRLLRAMDAYKQAFLFVDASRPGWRVLYMNDEAVKRTGAGLAWLNELSRRCYQSASGYLRMHRALCAGPWLPSGLTMLCSCCRSLTRDVCRRQAAVVPVQCGQPASELHYAARHELPCIKPARTL